MSRHLSRILPHPQRASALRMTIRGFAQPENRLKFYAAAEKFLAKHLGSRSEPDQPVSNN